MPLNWADFPGYVGREDIVKYSWCRVADNWGPCLIGPNFSVYFGVELSGTHCICSTHMGWLFMKEKRKPCYLVECKNSLNVKDSFKV